MSANTNDVETPFSIMVNGTPIFNLSDSTPSIPVQFNPSIHLSISKPAYQLSMADLGLSIGISPVAVTAPFSLFTKEAVDIMRREILCPEVLKRYSFASSINQYQVRGFHSETPFTTAAWTHPATVAAVSAMAGIELTPVFNYEIAHTNISVAGDSKPVVGWHNDSYPFVCVLMVSDTTDMVGGETCLRKPDGEIIKVADPKQGHATVLQGGYITHMASRPADLDRERITLVTSYRPKDAMIRDDSVLTTVRPISNRKELFTQWMDYRSHVLSQRFATMQKGLIDGDVSVEEMVAFFKDQEKFIRHTCEQMEGEMESEHKL